MRRPLEGVWNVVRFNWHFYVGAGSGLLALAAATYFSPATWQLYLLALLVPGILPVIVSLLVSYYVYDVSDLYRFGWLTIDPGTQGRMANIHAGFDETSTLLRQRFAQAELHVFDFYDPDLHREVSIKRARAAYPPFPGTITVQPQALPLPGASTDYALVLLSAHEIRQQRERVAFFKEIRRTLLPQGRIIVVEHLRDPANFLAYTIGFFHFYSRATWLQVFRAAGLEVVQEQKITPFVSAFTLQVHGNSS
ncbi:class I SAM-dependent methyltransferase [Hymenobacter cellulosilyticus]|uniref:Methyltransferase n=1 Tax=Hymenobacter cellulosilyticus TaxID=2932248 RepID=A0A8T9Q2Q9_9BACT|nr:class I SAM-dependent methyltransferase [Hymenobacter cellulosilyticus]UOQ70138.1 methyltransferase [Hymenobacter cellulosilyticus]